MLLEIFPQHLRDPTGAGERRIGQQYDELFTAITAFRVAAAQDRVHALPHMREHRIAAQMSESVIDFLEVIEIQHH